MVAWREPLYLAFLGGAWERADQPCDTFLCMC